MKKLVNNIKNFAKHYYTDKLKNHKKKLLKTTDINSLEINLKNTIKIALIQEIIDSYQKSSKNYENAYKFLLDIADYNY